MPPAPREWYPILQCITPYILRLSRCDSHCKCANTHQLMLFMAACKGFLMVLREGGVVTNLDVAFYRVPSLSFLSHFADIHRLDRGNTGVVGQRGNLVDISALKNCPMLVELSIEFTKVHDISVLVGCIQLERLGLLWTCVSDISVLRHCTKLVELRCCHLVSDISALRHCPNLESLDCKFTKVVDVSPLAHCPRLNTLHLDYTGVQDLAPLKLCPYLDFTLTKSDPRLPYPQ